MVIKAFIEKGEVVYGWENSTKINYEFYTAQF